MNMIINQMSQTPIYEQVEEQIRKAILSGQLNQGDILPSIRALARKLGIGIITVRRAYDDLCAEGIIVSLQGRGVFVAEIDKEEARRIRLDKLRKTLTEVKKYCDTSDISKEELMTEIKKIYEVRP